MLKIYIVISCLAIITLAYLPIVYRIEEYANAWSKLGYGLRTEDLSHLANPQQSCGDKPCSFNVYFEDRNKLSLEKNRNKTVLIVGGLKGNDYLGPSAILNLYGDLKGGNAAQVIYFPIANPSGFTHNTAETYPQKINVEEDFPMLSNVKCNQSSAVRILDYLFRMYPIDLTIYVLQGLPGVTFSWTTDRLNNKANVAETPIQKWIATSLQQRYSQLAKQQKTTESNLAVTPSFQVQKVKSDFIDWAYGASKYPQILGKICNNKQFQLYSENTMKGLSIGLSVGFRSEAGANNEKLDSIMKRAVQLTKQLIALTNPEIQLQISSNHTLTGKLVGCQTANITKLFVMNEGNIFIGERQINKQLNSSERWTNLGKVELKQNQKIPEIGQFYYEFVCDSQWSKIGTTFMSQERAFSSSKEFRIASPQNQQSQTSSIVIKTAQNRLSESQNTLNNPTEPKAKEFAVTPSQITSNTSDSKAEKSKKEDEQSSILKFLKSVGTIILGICACGCLVNCSRAGAAVIAAKGPMNLRQKFQKIELAQNSQMTEQEFSHPSKSNQLQNKDPTESSSLTRQ